MSTLRLGILGLILSLTITVLADSSTEITVKLKTKSDGILVPATAPRQYPKYKTEKGLLKGYATAWSAGDYDLMYHLLATNVREEWTVEKFERLFKADAASNGGLAGFERPKRISGNASKSLWTLTLIYKNSSARKRGIRTTLIREGKVWHVAEGGLLPPDLSEFDR